MSTRNYCVRRAAVVPLPAPSMRPAKEASGYVEAGLSSDTLFYARPPRSMAGSNVGLYVPREQLGGYIAVSPHRVVSIGTSFEYGLGVGSVPISEGLIPPPKHGVGGGGLHLSLHFKVNPIVTLDWTSDVWGYEIPSRVAYIQSSDCSEMEYDENWTDKIMTSRMFIARTQFSVGLDLGFSHLTVGVGVRNHPYNEDVTEERHISTSGIGPRLKHTPYPYFVAGWEVHFTEQFHATIGVYQPLNFDPVIYAPVMGISLRITQVVDGFGGRERRRPPPPRHYEDGPFEIPPDYRQDEGEPTYRPPPPPPPVYEESDDWDGGSV